MHPRSQTPSIRPGRASGRMACRATLGRMRRGEPGDMPHHGRRHRSRRHRAPAEWCPVPPNQRMSSGVRAPSRRTARRIGRGGPLRGIVTSAHSSSPGGRSDGSGMCSGMKKATGSSSAAVKPPCAESRRIRVGPSSSRMPRNRSPSTSSRARRYSPARASAASPASGLPAAAGHTGPGWEGPGRTEAFAPRRVGVSPCPPGA